LVTKWRAVIAVSALGGVWSVQLSQQYCGCVVGVTNHLHNETALKCPSKSCVTGPGFVGESLSLPFLYSKSLPSRKQVPLAPTTKISGRLLRSRTYTDYLRREWLRLLAYMHPGYRRHLTAYEYEYRGGTEVSSRTLLVVERRRAQEGDAVRLVLRVRR
jgi:hypothetical protein